MKKHSIRILISVFLAVATLLPLCCISAGAESLDGVKNDKNILWELDFSKMENPYDNLGSKEYTLSSNKQNVVFEEFEGQKVLAIKNSNDAYFINDTDIVLDTYDAYYMEAEMYFESYPTGKGTDNGLDSHEYPMSFVTWITIKDGKKSFGSIRVDNEGYLCTTTGSANNRLSDTAKLPLGEWFNIRFIVSPTSRLCEVFINHESVGSYALGRQTGPLSGSQVRFFDTRYTYTAYFKNISVSSDSGYRIGITSEVSADYLGYQTSKVTNGNFDLRVLAGLDSLDYNEVGCTVDVLYLDGKETVTSEETVHMGEVYESVQAIGTDGKQTTVTAESLGHKYLAAVTLKDLSAEYDNALIVMRPFAVVNGVKRYGTPRKMMLDTTTGYPVFKEIDETNVYTLTVSEDTYIGGRYKQYSDQNPHGTEDVMDIKNSGNNFNSQTTRHAYLKFYMTDRIREILASAGRVTIKVYGLATRSGVVGRISGVTSNWDEATLTKPIAASTVKVNETIGDFTYGAKAWYSVDVTDYVKKHLSDDSISFRIENVSDDGSSENAIYSREYDNGTYAPTMEIIPSELTLNYEVNLSKLTNKGYEPWGYAETIVDKWFDGGEREAVWETPTYDSLGTVSVKNNEANGEYTVYNPIVGSTANTYVRTLDTLKNYTKGEDTQFDEYLGITNLGVKGEATGFYHAETIDGVNYIIDPLGNPFYSMGVNTLTAGTTKNQKNQTIKKYGSIEAFYHEIRLELTADCGLTTVSGLNDEAMKVISEDGGIAFVARPNGGITGYMGSLSLSVSTGGSAAFYYNNTMNLFDPDFISYVNPRIASECAKYKDNPYLLGYTVDNEIPGGKDILMRYLTLDHSEPVNAFSYATAWTWFRRATGEINPSLDLVTDTLNEEFLCFLYNRYFSIISAAFDKYDPNHMYMGNRCCSPTNNQEGFLRAAGAYLDVMTINLYGKQDYASINSIIENMHKYSGLAFIVSEYGTRAQENHGDINGYTLANYSGTACWLFETQQQRVNSYESYVLNLLQSRNCVGWWHYRFQDNDQSLYEDPSGNLYILKSGTSAIDKEYVNVKTGEVFKDIKGVCTIFYQGETDTSNLTHNKGLYDNFMEPYTEMQEAMKTVSDNLVSLIKHFAK